MEVNIIMKGLVEAIEKEGMKKNVPEFNVGDTVKVGFKVIEGTKERIQNFEGVVIAKKHGGVRESFTVRRLSFGVGVERTFPLHSPKIASITVVRKGKVRRAKLYYLRGLTGKAAKIAERTRSLLSLTAVSGSPTRSKETIPLFMSVSTSTGTPSRPLNAKLYILDNI